MTRKRRDITDVDVDRWISLGFGQGEEDGFRPWMKIRDVPSLGRSTRIAGLKSRRTHHLLSDVEYGHFLVAEYRADVAEIREQIALLPRDDTLRIADELGMRHPTYPGTRTPIVMTSDFWISIGREGQSQPVILSVKRTQALLPQSPRLARDIEKLSIERRYWQERGIPWGLGTEADFDSIVVRNLGLLRPSPQAWHSGGALERARAMADRVIHPVNAHCTFRDVLQASGWGQEVAYEAFGLAVWKHWIPLNLHKAPRWELPIPLTAGG
jgi:hypothetical protein